MLKPTFVYFSVAVLACFVTFRTPLHIEKAIFVITTVTQKWDENMMYYHGILKLIAGKISVLWFLRILVDTNYRYVEFNIQLCTNIVFIQLLGTAKVHHKAF